MHFAVHFNRENAVKLLRRRGANVSIRDDKGNTPASLYISKHSHSIHSNLLGHLAHSDDFHIHCSCGNLNAVETGIERGVDVNRPSKFTTYNGTNRTPLHLAVQSNDKMNAQLVTLLLKNGANPNSRDIELNTPLILITKSNSTLDMMKTLFIYNADVNARNMYGETALMAFVDDYRPSRSLPGRIQFLLTHGAHINIEDEKGDIPFSKLHSLLCTLEGTQRSVVASIVLLMKHMKKLKMIGLYFSKKNEQYYFKFVELYKATDYLQRSGFC